MTLRTTLLLLIPAACAMAQPKYNGPKPAKSDLPYLVHADNLVPTEAVEAREQKGKKDQITYTVAGGASSSKTPLASPIFLIQTQDLAASKLQLFKLEVKSGQREFPSPRRSSRRPSSSTPRRSAPAGCIGLRWRRRCSRASTRSRLRDPTRSSASPCSERDHADPSAGTAPGH